MSLMNRSPSSRSYWLDFPLKAGNKGFEGVSALHYAGDDYLLCLCEGNKCKSGSAGVNRERDVSRSLSGLLTPGQHAGAIRLPEAVRFRDYSSLDFHNGLLTVISQATSALWIGRLRGRSWPVQKIYSSTMVGCICSHATIKVGLCTVIPRVLHGLETTGWQWYLINGRTISPNAAPVMTSQFTSSGSRLRVCPRIKPIEV